MHRIPNEVYHVWILNSLVTIPDLNIQKKKKVNDFHNNIVSVITSGY